MLKNCITEYFIQSKDSPKTIQMADTAVKMQIQYAAAFLTEDVSTLGFRAIFFDAGGLQISEILL